jgi:hypothetical protein
VIPINPRQRTRNWVSVPKYPAEGIRLHLPLLYVGIRLSRAREIRRKIVMSQRMISVAGMMTSSGGDLYHVRLKAAVVELPEPYEVEDAQIARLDLATGVSNLPDGDYILEYFYRKPFNGNVRIKSGRLMML